MHIFYTRGLVELGTRFGSKLILFDLCQDLLEAAAHAMAFKHHNTYLESVLSQQMQPKQDLAGSVLFTTSMESIEKTIIIFSLPQSLWCV